MVTASAGEDRIDGVTEVTSRPTVLTTDMVAS